MKSIHQTTTITNKMAGILLLSLLATPALMRAQHNRLQNNSQVALPSRPAPSISTPEPRENRPTPPEHRPAPPEHRPIVEEVRSTPRVHTPEPPPSRPAVNINKPPQRETEPVRTVRPAPASAPNTVIQSGIRTAGETRATTTSPATHRSLLLRRPEEPCQFMKGGMQMRMFAEAWPPFTTLLEG